MKSDSQTQAFPRISLSGSGKPVGRFSYSTKNVDKQCTRVIGYKRYIIRNLLFAVLPFCVTNAAVPDAPYNLRSFDKYNPIGTGPVPYFGWYVSDPDDNEIQTAYQILIATTAASLNSGKGDIWDSGKVSSGTQNYVYANGKTLRSDTRYYWKVRTWDKDGNMSPYSISATFDTGMLENKDWAGASWVSRDTNEDDDYTYFRKRFQLPRKKIRRATAYISACHSYQLYVNGKFIGKGFNNHYPQYSYFQAWDVSSSISTGFANTVACMTHWYGGGQGRATGSRGLLVKVVVQFSDSTTAVIGTDGSWKQSRAEQWIGEQPQRNGEGIGRVEKIDSRKAVTDWNTVGFNDTSWRPAKVIGKHPVAPWTSELRPDLTKVIEEEIKPASVTDLGRGTYVIDLGKIYAGSFKIDFSGGISGDTIRMHGGYVLENDGTVSRKINQGTNLGFYFIHNGKTSVFNPEVYLGMRYLQIDNAPNSLNAENVRFICRHFELDPARSGFSSSNLMLDRVWELMRHSLMVGAQEGFVDTPTREKGAFLSDGWSQAVPAMSVMGDRAMNWRVLHEFLDSQDQYWPDGRLNAVYPNVDGARDIPDYTQAFLVWTWDYYMQTGNKAFLQNNYNKLKKIADYVYNYRNDSTGLIHNLKGGDGLYEHGIIDWPVSMRYGYDMSVESRTVVDVYAWLDFELIARLAGIVGNRADQDNYQARANSMKDAINSRLINKDGVYVDGVDVHNKQSLHVSQHANIFPLAMDIVPSDSRSAVIAEVKNRKMNVGMVSLRWLPESLGKADEGAHLIDLYTNTEWDGWAKTILRGGTVTWESWNANLNKDSMSHPWGAVGLLAMQQYILGVQALKPQHELIQIKPLAFGDRLSFARGILPTDRGDIGIAWNSKGESFSLTIHIPDNVTARVYVPKCGKNGLVIKSDGAEMVGVEEGNYIRLENIGSGVHTFER
jgi:alpha-L-rhamnosidase